MEPLFLKIFNRTFEIQTNEKYLTENNELNFNVDLGIFKCFISWRIPQKFCYIYTSLSEDGIDEKRVKIDNIEYYIEQLVINHFKDFSSAGFTIEEVVEKAILIKNNNLVKEIIE